jgi:hypothetical protein
MIFADALTLVPATMIRGGIDWSDSDYEVRDGDKVIGRIILNPQAPKEAPWFWTIIARGRMPSSLACGYAVSREQAMVQLKEQNSLYDFVCLRVADLLTPPLPSFIARCVYCSAQVWVAVNSPSPVRRICFHCAEDRQQVAG